MWTTASPGPHRRPVPAPAAAALLGAVVELVGGLALIAGLLVVGALGAGRFSADELLTRRLQHV
jgi:uncharacterized membrane protein YphA (DoxX/SURF4 family)